MKQHKFAFLVGSSEFPMCAGELEALPNAGPDVRRFEKVLEDPEIGGFSDVRVALDLPHYEVLLRTNQIMREADRDDQVFLYYSGHGVLDSQSDMFLATVNTDPEFLQSTAVPTDSLINLLRETECRRIIVILDCCYSGSIDPKRIAQTIYEGFVEIRKSASSGYAITIIAAPDMRKATGNDTASGAGAMTAAMIDAIKTGQGDANYDGVITVRELYDYTSAKLIEQDFEAPFIFEHGATGSLTVAISAREFAPSGLINSIQSLINQTRAATGTKYIEILDRAEEIIQKPGNDIAQNHEASFSLLRDWANGRINNFESVVEQWYQFDETGLVATDKVSEFDAFDNDAQALRSFRRPLLELISPCYILDRNYHFLDWNSLFDELIAKPMGLTRHRHVEDFILKLRNHTEVIARAKKVFSDTEYPIVDIEDLEYESPKYGLIIFKKIAAQIPSQHGEQIAWSCNLNIVYVDQASMMWEDLHKRLTAEVNWSMYAMLYDSMLLKFTPYKKLIQQLSELVGDAKVVADLGSGTGNVTFELLANSASREVLSLESNEEMIQHMRDKLADMQTAVRQRVTLCKGDLMVTLRDLEHSTLDAAIMMNTLYAIPDRTGCLREIYRVLKPGGVLVYSTSTSETNVDNLFSTIRRDLEAQGELDGLRSVVDLAYDRHVAMHDSILQDSPDSVVDYARQAGFQIDDEDVIPKQYEGAVTIVRAKKPEFVKDRVWASDSSQTILKPVAEPYDTVVVSAPPELPTPSEEIPQLFISYAREDRVWCESIRKYMQPAEDSGRLKIWDDSAIAAGKFWEPEIRVNLNNASVALLLVSQSFLGSEYIRKRELPWILEKLRCEELTVIPVLIELAPIRIAEYYYPDHITGPYSLKIGDLQIETYEESPISHLDRAKQNLFIDRLAESILSRLPEESSSRRSMLSA